MKIKLLLVILIVFYGVFLLAEDRFAQGLELVTLQYPPYEYEENGKIKGIAVEIVQEVFKRMDNPITIRLLPWAEALENIKQGKADAIFTAFKTPEREEFADYSEEILMPQLISLFVLKDSPIEFDGDLSKLSDYKFGIVKKISYGELFDNAVRNHIITKLNIVNTGEQNMEVLLKGQIEILVSNKYGALYILKKMDKSDKVRELKPQIEDVPSYIAFSKKKKLTSLRIKFDRILRAMKDDGNYQRIIDAHFSTSVR